MSQKMPFATCQIQTCITHIDCCLWTYCVTSDDFMFELKGEYYISIKMTNTDNSLVDF